MDKIRVSAVSYTNSLPFIYGIEHSEVMSRIVLSRDIPSHCAYKLIHDQADVGIVPVGALPDIEQAAIIGEYCLGAVGAVNSVFIFSSKPIEEVVTLRLDAQSRTSNRLAAILLRYYWKREVEIVESGEADAYVEIGDRTFGKPERSAYSYDLSLYWQRLTGLPFAFAVWAANKPVPDEFVRLFNEALRYGIEHREALIRTLPKRLDFDYHTYLMKNIDYVFDEGKQQAVKEFLRLMKTLEPLPQINKQHC